VNLSQLNNFIKVGLRPFAATKMLWNHKRTLAYMIKKGWYKRACNFAFVTYFVRGEDCGKGCLDPLFYLDQNTVPTFWDIELEVTTRCPLSCKHCERTYFPKDYGKDDLTLSQFKKIIDSIPQLKWINLTGEGSPFMNKDFMAMLRYAKSQNIYVDFSHDFFTFNDSIGRSLIEMGIERIYFSIDGCTKETYEKVRIGSDYNKVISNIRRFIQLKKEMQSPLPEICFRFAFFKDNVHEVKMLPALVNGLGSVNDLGDESSINIVGLLEFEQTKGLEVEIDKKTIESTNARAKEFGQTVYWSHVTHDESKKAPCHYCVFWTEPYIMITGHVVPDCAVLMSNRRPFLEANSFGNVNEMPLVEMWDTPKYKKFRKMLRNPNAPVPSICYGCRVYETKFRAERYKIWDMSKE
jgi:MoaA/NifB/PqqE/SkfB family radical SAM enzyme